MSNSACTKKILCNAKAAAAQTSADRIVFQVIVPAMERGELPPWLGEKMILAFADADEDYIARVDALVSEVIATFDRAASESPGRPPSNINRGEPPSEG